MNSKIHIHVHDYRRAVHEYSKFWAQTDARLKSACSGDCIQHSSIGLILSKVLLIGRGFASGIERKISITNTSGTQAGIRALAEHLYRNKDKMNAIILSLKGCKKINEHSIKIISEAHGKFCCLLKEVTRDEQIVRSFASKYLHFHNSIVPIYDSFASAQMKKMIDKKALSLCKSDFAQDKYFKYLKGILQIHDELLNRSPKLIAESEYKPNARKLEYYALWQSRRS